MNEVIKVNTSKGDIYIETSVAPIAQSPSRVRNMSDVGFNSASSSEIVTLTKDAFDSSLEGLKEIASLIISKVKDASPDKIEMEFGFKLSGSGNLFIAKCTTEGNFSVKLTWEKSDQQ